MKFLLLSTPDPKAPPAPPTPKMMEEMDRFIAAEKKAGRLLATGGLLPVSMGGARIRSAGGQITVTDGPFSEAKEVVAGFAMVQVASREEAIACSTRFFQIVGDGEGEIRQIMDADDMPRP